MVLPPNVERRVKPRIVPLRIGVVSPPAKESRAAWTIEEIRKSIDDANDVFSQIGVTFQLASLSNITDRAQAWNLVKYRAEGIPGTEDSWEDETEDYSFLQSVNTERDTIRKGGNAIEIFFVGTIRDSADVSEDVQFAFVSNGQVYMPRGMSRFVLAHEIGHVLGLEDIYVDNRYDAKGLRRQWVELPQKGDPVYCGFFTEGSHDWGRERGRGFYERTDSRGLIIRKFLMYGYVESEENAEHDIPDDAVRGVPASATRLEQIRHIPIGAKTVEKAIKERQR